MSILSPFFKYSVSSLSFLPSVEPARLDEGEYFRSKVVITTTEEIRDTIVEERSIKEEVKHKPETLPPQTVTERDDDWFELLDVVPRDVPYVPPGIA